jgi:hypothetical protein
MRPRLMTLLYPCLLVLFLSATATTDGAGRTSRHPSQSPSKGLVVKQIQIRLYTSSDINWNNNEVFTLYADGRATLLHGNAGAHDSKTWEGSFPTLYVLRLAELIDSAGFFSFDNKYITGPSHGRVVTTTVAVEGDSKSVLHFGQGGPVALWGIERAILGVWREVHWKADWTGQLPPVRRIGFIKARPARAAPDPNWLDTWND